MMDVSGDIRGFAWPTTPSTCPVSGCANFPLRPADEQRLGSCHKVAAAEIVPKTDKVFRMFRNP